MPRRTPKWRTFERLVAQTEQMLVPVGAIVKCPDRIVDRHGRRREVDASIRYKVGSTPVLITIECRYRKSRQDQTWIEQLVTKKENLRAARTIAASASPLSEAARELAKHHGIETRQIDALTADQIRDWCLMRTMTWIDNRMEVLSANLISTPEEGDPIGPLELVHKPSSLSHFASTPLLKAVRDDGSHKMVSPMFLVQSFRQQHPHLHDDLPLDGSRTRRSFNITLGGTPLFVETAIGERRVVRLDVEAELWCDTKELPCGDISQYSSEDGPIAQRVEFPLPDSIGDLRLVLAHQVESGQTSLLLTGG